MDAATDPSPAKPHSFYDMRQQQDESAQNHTDAIDPISKRRAEDESINDEEKKQKMHPYHAIDGKQNPNSPHSSPPTSPGSQPAPNPEPTPKSQSSGGWNTGIKSGGLRVGFAKPILPNTANSTPDPLKYSPVKTVMRQKHAWVLPAWPMGQDACSWDLRLESWVDLFVEANTAAIRKLKVTDFQFLALAYLDINLSKGQKKHCRAALMKYIRAGKWTAQVEKFTSRPPSLAASPRRSMSPNSACLLQPRMDVLQERPADITRPAKADISNRKVEGNVKAVPYNYSNGQTQKPVSSKESTEQAMQLDSSEEEGEVTTSDSEEEEEEEEEDKDEGISAGSQAGGGQRPVSREMLENHDTNTPQDEQELAQLRLYFPDFPDSELCLSCKGAGHNRTWCPYRSCRWCGKTDAHRYLACPLRARCLKCHQLGHQAGGCSEKLKATAEQGLHCRHCDGAHQDHQCHMLWRTTYHDPAKVNKVKYIPVSCYTCGASGHYGTACSFRGTAVTPADYFWTEENRSLYLDPSCSQEAIADPGPEPIGPPLGLGMKIKGKARHVEYTDDDDSDDEGLVRAPVSKPRAMGMKISPNIQHKLPPLPPQPQAPSGPSNGRGGFSNLRRGGGGGGYRGKYRGGRGKSRGGRGQ